MSHQYSFTWSHTDDTWTHPLTLQTWLTFVLVWLLVTFYAKVAGCMTFNHLVLHLLGLEAHISTNCVMHRSMTVTLTDKLDSSCNDSITIWEKKQLPCTFAMSLGSWLINISFYICSMFLHLLWLLSWGSWCPIQSISYHMGILSLLKYHNSPLRFVF